MATVNKEITDLAIRHQVGILRLSTGTVKKLMPILNRADAEIVAKLASRSATLEGSFTSARLESLLVAIREINRDAHSAVGRELRKELRELARYEAVFQQSLLRSVLPVSLDVVAPTARVLTAVVTARPFQGKLLKDWLSELEVNKARRLRDAIRLGMVQGETTQQIMNRVRGTRAMQYKDGALEISRRGAESLVRTAVAHTASAARGELYKANADIIDQEVWVATLDTDTCPTCQALDGRRFDMGQGTQSPVHIRCRCLRVPITKSWKELGFDIDDLPPGARASMDGQVPANQNYGDWLRTQSKSVQDEALGPTRGRLFRKGGLDVRAFTNRRGDQLTLDQLRSREADAFKKAGIAA